MKKICSFVLCILLTFLLCACGETPQGSDSDVTLPSDSGNLSSDSLSDGGSSESSDEVQNTADPVPNMVLTADQYNDRVTLYDLDLLEKGDSLDDAEIWSMETYHPAGLKYREDTVFGDVIVVAGLTSGIYSYPSGEALWTTNNSGNNPHSVEILPSGNIVIANSSGATLRLFTTSVLASDPNGKVTYSDYNLFDAHGVLYDPEYEVLWALGGEELTAYALRGEGAEEKLLPMHGMGVSLPSDGNGGHDLSADLTDVRYLYLSVNSRVYRFDKEENELIEKFNQYAKLSTEGVKGFGNNQNGNFFFMFPNGGVGTEWENESIAPWSTDTLYYCYWKSEHLLYKESFVSEKGAFYKCRVFYGQYQ